MRFVLDDTPMLLIGLVPEQEVRGLMLVRQLPANFSLVN